MAVWGRRILCQFDKTNKGVKAAGFDLKKIKVAQQKHRLWFIGYFKGRIGPTTHMKVLIKTKWQTYGVGGHVKGVRKREGFGRRTGPAKYRRTARKIYISFNLRAIGRPDAIDWGAFSTASYWSDSPDYLPDEVNSLGYVRFELKPALAFATVVEARTE